MYSFLKNQRLRKRGQFVALFQKKRCFSIEKSDKLLLDWAFSDSDRVRIGITVTTKQGSSVERNLFKRWGREAFRQSPLSKRPVGIDINLRVRGPLASTASGASRRLVDYRMVQRLFDSFGLYLDSRRI